MEPYTTPSTPWWERPSGRHPSYNASGANLPIPVHTPSPSSPANPRATCKTNGTNITVLTPSIPASANEFIRGSATHTITSASPLRSDTTPTFTNHTRSALRPYGSYGEGFTIEPSTEETRLHTWGKIFGDVPSGSGSSGSLETRNTELCSGERATLQSRYEQFGHRVKRGLTKVRDSAVKRVKRGRVVEHIVLQRMKSVRQRSVKSRWSPFRSHLCIVVVILPASAYETRNQTAQAAAEGRCKVHQGPCCSLTGPSHEDRYAQA
jgi:hypothetical protein